MPKGYRYMSQHKGFLMNNGLPLDRKFILNKTVPGCGGTSMFLESDFPLVLISPRIQVLKDKHEQYPDSFLFYIPFTNADRRKEETLKMLSRLNEYITQRTDSVPFAGKSRYPKILVSIDSAKKVLDVISGMNLLGQFIFLVDEFQCLMGDASFKGSTDMNFLSEIDRMVDKICYLSATPIPDIYLDHIPQFRDIPYIQLEWDPDVLEEPTVREIQMKKGESPEKICEAIIHDYREKGYFARKVLDGSRVVYSREVCIFVNEVKKIKNIILKNNIQPDEVTILCAEGSSSDLPKGFTIGGLCTDKNNPQNRTFTFCTKASFEGVDFYSDNAITYIFIDGTKDWLALDIFLDLPQILGRQRLDCNPFKHDATIYYRTKPDVESRIEFEQIQKAMESETQDIITEFNCASPKMKKILMDSIRNASPESKFQKDYIDIIEEGGVQTIGFNTLVQTARWNRWYQKQFFYRNSCQLLSGMASSFGMRKRPQEVKEFENKYYSTDYQKRLELYTEFRHVHPEYGPFLQQNPYVATEYHDWYERLGYDTISQLKFNDDAVERKYNEHISVEPIRNACRRALIPGVLYKKDEVKNTLQKIYDSLGLVGKKAKAVEIERYLTVKEAWYSEDGKRNRGYVILETPD